MKVFDSKIKCNDDEIDVKIIHFKGRDCMNYRHISLQLIAKRK